MPAYGFLEDVPAGSGIGVEVDATPFYSPFYGSHYENRVYALRGADTPRLRGTVTTDAIDYLFLRRGSALDRRASREVPGLRRIFGDRNVRVYRLQPPDQRLE
jgi:hypothetical protein